MRLSGRWVAVLGGLAVLLAIAGGTGVARADGPQDEVRGAQDLVERARAAAVAGDVAGARQQYAAFEQRWQQVEDSVRGSSAGAYDAIKRRMDAAHDALAGTAADPTASAAALSALDQEFARFLAGLPPLTDAPAQPGARPATVSTLLSAIAATRSAVHDGDLGGASARFADFERAWPAVEGEIKTRSEADYRATENDMARMSAALAAGSPDLAVLDAMQSRLQPYQTAGHYGATDAAIILLREGLEAILVVGALLAFVKRSGNGGRAGWIWGGAAAGVFASVVLGVAINVVLGRVLGGEHRELLEGITGLTAAAMLLYVSYWLHRQASLGAWRRYIAERTTRALARGSLIGLALLAFLAVFREGGETALFFLGMAGKISAANLAIGLGAGTILLAGIAVAVMVLGMRLPLRPFFMGASLLTFYLCFKFIGTGLHSLQVADVLPANTAGLLPDNGILGLFPTWQTTLPQIVLLALGALAVLRLRGHRVQEADVEADVETAQA